MGSSFNNMLDNLRQVFDRLLAAGKFETETKEMSSLSVEYSDGHPGFVCSIFEVPNDDMMENGVPSASFLEREEEFNIIQVPYIDLSEPTKQDGLLKKGILCTAYTDQGYLERWGYDRFRKCSFF